MKATPKQILSALNELIKESKTEMKSEKIELGVRILTQFVSDLKKANAEVRKLGNKMMSASAGADTAYEGTNKELKVIEKQVKELGLKISDVPDYKEAKTELNKYDKLVKEFGL